MDHVPLVLKKIVEPPQGVLSDEEILQRIISEVKQIIKRKQSETS
jgi:formylmethanofuran dehydrogenase subunit B